MKPTDTMPPDECPTPQGLNVICRRSKGFDPFKVGNSSGSGTLWVGAIRGFHPRLMILFPSGELVSANSNAPPYHARKSPPGNLACWYFMAAPELLDFAGDG